MIDISERRPEWLKVRLANSPVFAEMKQLLRDQGLHTVCEEAHCPNIHECFSNRTATFMILGDICTRACAYCAVTTGRPLPVDVQEPDRVARAAQSMGLKHVVVTSVDRDDLKDGGAGIFAETIRLLREYLPNSGVEALIPDFQCNEAALRIVMYAKPDILNHNTETVERLYKRVRPKTTYQRCLNFLRLAKTIDPTIKTKTGIMLGLGETDAEIEQTLRDIRDTGVEILTMGQYLRPSAQHVPLAKYYTPDEFLHWKQFGLSLGYKHVESGPLVRSSYHAHEQSTGATTPI